MLVGAFPNEEEVGLSNKQWCWTLHLQTFWFPCLLRELGSDLSQPVVRDIWLLVLPASLGSIGLGVVVTAHLQQSFVV